MKRIKFCVATCLFCISLTGIAADKDQPAANPEEKKPVPEAKVSVTEHSARIGSSKINYTATAGTLLMKNEKGEPNALFGYTAYIKKDADRLTRPIMFAYNGGPGSASLWLHMGILGPQRAVIDDTQFMAPPFKRVANEFSIIDEVDLVMIDPVGTGYSRAVGDAKDKDFWGTDQDIKSVSAFIHQYITENNRWQSPKYILGESYGAMRSAGVANYLLDNYMIAVNGIIFVSPFLQFVTGFDMGQADLPYVLFLPTFAATAWYHNAIAKKPASVKDFVKQAEKFATEEYAPALMKGSQLSAADRQALAEKLESFTGVSANYWLQANLRVGHQAFTKELLKNNLETVGRIDSRYKGYSLQAHAQEMQYDPLTAAIGPPMLAAFMDYYRTELKSEQDSEYVVFGDVFAQWDLGHVQPDSGGFKVPYPDTATDLTYAMIKNPKMRLLFQQGYYDLATPQFTTEYTIDHLNIPNELRKNISIRYYEAGHMMYVHEPSMGKFKQDIVEFLHP